MVNTAVAELEVFQSTIQSNVYSYCVHVHGHTCTLFTRPLHTLVVAHELSKHIVFQLHKSLQLGVVVMNHVWVKGQKTWRTEVTPRQKPPCFGADPLECNQRVCSVIFRVIIFRSSIQAVGQITQQPTGRPQPSRYVPGFRLDVYSLSFHLIIQRTYYN